MNVLSFIFGGFFGCFGAVIALIAFFAWATDGDW
jgi:hypothetical protein